MSVWKEDPANFRNEWILAKYARYASAIPKLGKQTTTAVSGGGDVVYDKGAWQVKSWIFHASFENVIMTLFKVQYTQM